MHKLLMGIAIGFTISVGILIQYQAEQERQQANIRNRIPPPPNPGNVRNFNFKTNTWRNYSDEEIRIMREKLSFHTGEYYIKTPGRHVPTFEERVEDYIDDNIEDIIDNY